MLSPHQHYTTTLHFKTADFIQSQHHVLNPAAHHFVAHCVPCIPNYCKRTQEGTHVYVAYKCKVVGGIHGIFIIDYKDLEWRHEAYRWVLSVHKSSYQSLSQYAHWLY